ncbi:hypothetical protein DL766_006306 [Monosporascus sp. MC13-8B]|uniref:Uncharacterized protein n=1 Tax=Monosporascus cannonballus TaxID=155416 RepID=A0ABY0H726_9PEZI|nr:hypothetical protein DL762_004680 [Monosporascus cannonballus]RYO98513.1 hypothetical protein DL763_002165 [Monosporascus cannonballus]RYP27580.1 hypothetical protein DL766_006306 [Monosporascus sp. MC13-8B]
MSRGPEDRSSPRVRTEIAIYPEDTVDLLVETYERLHCIVVARADVFEAYKGLFLNDDYERNIAATQAAIDDLRRQVCSAVSPYWEEVLRSMTAWGSRLRIDYHALVERLGDPDTTEQESEALGSALAELKLIFNEPEDAPRLAVAWNCSHTVSKAKIVTYMQSADIALFRELDADDLALSTQTEFEFYNCMETIGYWLLALEEAGRHTGATLELQESYEESKNIITNVFKAAGLEELTLPVTVTHYYP